MRFFISRPRRRIERNASARRPTGLTRSACGILASRRAKCYLYWPPIITLPGNPVSALVSFEVFLRAPLRSAMGLPHPERPRRTAVLLEDLTSPRGKRQFRRGVFETDPETGQSTVTSYGPPASHHLRWLASANCLLEIDEDIVELAGGSHVQIWDLA